MVFGLHSHQTAKYSFTKQNMIFILYCLLLYIP